MYSQVITNPPQREVRVKRLILPTEHGSWGFLLEPIVAAIAIGFSAAGGWITLMVVGAFLARQPLKFALLGLAGNGFREQTIAAIKFTVIFGIVFAAGFVGALATAPQYAMFPFLVIAPLASYQIFCDLSRKSRELLPELTGAVAISASAPAIALAAGVSFPIAMGLWAVFIGRLIPSILYVRNRLRLEKGKSYSILVPVSAHLVAVGAVGLLAANGLASYLTVGMFAFLSIRSWIGLSDYRRRIKAMRIGVWEVTYGTLTVISIIVGYYMGI
ncbi:MAG: YwiC-like family protein [Pyrinomonadaceae bacterium]|nr:YwiC-like family protein [Pyrinomonadaceae bacterium]